MKPSRSWSDHQNLHSNFQWSWSDVLVSTPASIILAASLQLDSSFQWSWSGYQNYSSSYLKMISIRLPKNVTPAGVKLECLSELSKNNFKWFLLSTNVTPASLQLECLSELSKNTFKWFLLSTNVTPASLQLECLPELSKTLKKWFLLPKNVTPAPLQLHSSYRFSRFSALNVWAQITLFRPMHTAHIRTKHTLDTVRGKHAWKSRRNVL